MIKSFLRKAFKKFKSAKIIMLHHVSEGKAYSPCIISTQNLNEFLSRNKKYLCIDQLLSSSKKQFQDGVVITIDDGLYDLYTVAYPLLTQNSIPFVAFISADLLDKEGYITTAQLLEMSKNPLVTIGSHGCTHQCLDELDIQQQKYEIEESKKKLEEILKIKVNYFAYSNGRYNKYTKKLVKKAGYKYAFGVMPRVFNCITKTKKYLLPRINLTNQTFKSI